jgi:hypothetical protein
VVGRAHDGGGPGACEVSAKPPSKYQVAGRARSIDDAGASVKCGSSEAHCSRVRRLGGAGTPSNSAAASSRSS